MNDKHIDYLRIHADKMVHHALEKNQFAKMYKLIFLFPNFFLHIPIYTVILYKDLDARKLSSGFLTEGDSNLTLLSYRD